MTNFDKCMRFADDFNRLGDAITSQAWAVLMDGEPAEDQNPNALRYAAEVLRRHGFEDEAEELTEAAERIENADDSDDDS